MNRSMIDSLIQCTGGVEYDNPHTVRCIDDDRVVGGYATYGLRNSLMEANTIGVSDAEDTIFESSNIFSENTEDDIFEPNTKNIDKNIKEESDAFLNLSLKDKVDHLIEKYGVKNEYMRSLRSLGDQLCVSDNLQNNEHIDESQLRIMINKKLATANFNKAVSFTPLEYPQCHINIPKEENLDNTIERALVVEKLLHNHMKNVEEYYRQIVDKIYEIQRAIR